MPLQYSFMGAPTIQYYRYPRSLPSKRRGPELHDATIIYRHLIETQEHFFNLLHIMQEMMQ